MEKAPSVQFDAPVPRYTSYPTAPHFQPGVNAVTYAEWLGNIGSDDTLSLYFHVPFCSEMCWYCGCHTKIVKRYKPIGDYAGLLADEVALTAAQVRGDPRVVHIHWGGGTPTMLAEGDFLSLMDTVQNHFPFADDAEVAVEMDPRTLTREMADSLACAGVNRASLGVQDFNDHVQQAINRIQPFHITERAVEWLKEAGIKAVNFDLMYGLPGQTVDDVIRTVDQAVRLGPNRLAVFGYAHVPWMKTHQRMIDEDRLPSGPERLAQVLAAERRLREHGYRAIGLDHFARPGDALAQALDEGRLRRNFQGYTTDRASVLLGFGASAIGSLTEGYVQNQIPFADYGRAIRKGRLAAVRGIQLTDDDRLRRAVIEQLMCGLAADLNEIAANFGLDETFTPELAALEPLAKDGLVDVTGSHVRITEQGRPWMRTIAAQFDRYLETGKARHSQAV